MGNCCGTSSKKDSKEPPKAPAPSSAPKPQSPPAPSAKRTPTFLITIRGEEVVAVRTGTNLALTVSANLHSADACKQAVCSPALKPDAVFYCIAHMHVVFVSLDETRDLPSGLPDTYKFESKVLAPGARLVYEGANVLEVQQANRQRIHYTTDDPTIKPGTPLLSENCVVGLHEKRGCGISINWICSELKGNFMSGLHPQLESFLSTVQGDFLEIDASSRVYSVVDGTIVSCIPTSDEFLDHDSGVPEDAKICYIPAGIFLAGGLENGQPSAKTFVFLAKNNTLFNDGRPMRAGRARHCLCHVKGAALCISGNTEAGPVADCDKYIVRSNSWEETRTVPSLPEPRLDACAVVFNDSVYVVGGAPGVCILRQSEWQLLHPQLPLFKRLVLGGSWNGSIWLCSEQLVQWKPQSDEVLVSIAETPFQPASSRVFDSSLYVFAGRDVYEARLDKDPKAWVLHKNRLPNFV